MCTQVASPKNEMKEKKNKKFFSVLFQFAWIKHHCRYFFSSLCDMKKNYFIGKLIKSSVGTRQSWTA